MSKPQPEKTKQTGRVKHRQGFTDFLAIGPDRSLDKLHDWYTKNVSMAPGRSIIGIWSTRYDWQARAAAHDEQVAGGVKEKVEGAAVEETWDRVKDLTEIARRSLKKALDALKGDTMTATDPYAVAALINGALSSIKTVELLTGGPTERFGYTVKDEAPEWMAEKLKVKAAEPTPTPTPTAAATSDETEAPESATRH